MNDYALLIAFYLLILFGIAGCYISCAHPHHRRRGRLNLAVLADGLLIGANKMAIDVSVVLGGVVHFRIAPTDDAGNPGPAQNVVFAADVGTVVVDADGLGAIYTPAGVGSAVFQVNGQNAGGTPLPPEVANITITEAVVLVTKLNLSVV